MVTVICGKQTSRLMVLVLYKVCKDARNLVHKFFCENISLSEGQFYQFFHSSECHILAFTLNAFQDVVMISKWLTTWFLYNWMVGNILYLIVPFLSVLNLIKDWEAFSNLFLPHARVLHIMPHDITGLLTDSINSNQKPLDHLFY